MLKYIIFILDLSYSTYLQNILSDTSQICEDLRGSGLKTEIHYSHTMNLDEWKKDNQIKQNTLFVTDNDEVLIQLLNLHFYAIAYMHDYNKRKDFSRAIYAIENIQQIEYDSFLKVYERLAKLPWHITDTDRLTIRETIVEDIESFYKIYQDPSVTYYMEGLYEDIEEEREYTKSYIEKMYGFYGYGVWTVILKDTGEIIGRVGFSWREGFESPELGFVIAREHQRKGYALEACQAIIDYAKEELEFQEIQIVAEEENQACRYLCQKLEFEYQKEIVLKEIKYGLWVRYC